MPLQFLNFYDNAFLYGLEGLFIGLIAGYITMLVYNLFFKGSIFPFSMYDDIKLELKTASYNSLNKTP